MLSMQIHFPPLAGATNVIRRKIRPMVACKEKGTHMRGIVKEIFKHTQLVKKKEHTCGDCQGNIEILAACKKSKKRNTRILKRKRNTHVRIVKKILKNTQLVKKKKHSCGDCQGNIETHTA